MLTALLADIHANSDALAACLRHARAAGAKRFVFLGDLVGYNADPAGTLVLVREALAAGGVAIRGNHDDAVANGTRGMDPDAATVIDWTRGQLDAADREFLAALPLVVREDAACYVHASMTRPERWDYVDGVDAAIASMAAAGAPYTFCGHVHEQMLYFETLVGKAGSFAPSVGTGVPVNRRRRWLAVVGSVGQPRDGNPAAAYALFDPATERLTFQRVPYDARAAAERIRAAGLPLGYALRLESGR